jgi:hypothetical protein
MFQLTLILMNFLKDSKTLRTVFFELFFQGGNIANFYQGTDYVDCNHHTACDPPQCSETLRIGAIVLGTHQAEDQEKDEKVENGDSGLQPAVC